MRSLRCVISVVPREPLASRGTIGAQSLRKICHHSPLPSSIRQPDFRVGAGLRAAPERAATPGRK